MGRYLQKGSRVYFEGRLQTRSWEDQSGQKRYATEIVASDMIMLDTCASQRSAGDHVEEIDIDDPNAPSKHVSISMERFSR